MVGGGVGWGWGTGWGQVKLKKSFAFWPGDKYSTN